MGKVLFITYLLCIGVTGAAQAQWTSIGGPPGGSALDIEVDVNNRIYTLVNSRKLYVSTNDAVSWSEVPFPTNVFVSDVLTDGQIVYAVTSGVLYKSENQGTTWIRATTGTQFTNVQRIIKHPTTGTFFLYGFGGLYVSIDGGSVWTKINDQNTSGAVINSSGDLFFSDTEGIAKHTKPGEGQQWTKENSTIVHPRTNNTIRLAQFGGNIYATVSNDVLRSSDNGASWPSIKTATITETSFTTSLWSVSSNGICLITSTKLYFNLNGAGVWTTKTFPTSDYASTSINDLKFTSDTKAFAGSSSDGVFKTTDGGSTWVLSSSGIHHYNSNFVGVSATGRIFTSRQGAKGYWSSANNGATWTYTGLNVYIDKLRRLPNNTLVTLGSSTLQYSNDNGSTWNPNGAGVSILDITNNTAFSATTYFGCSVNRIAKSTDGANWTNLTIAGLPATYNASKIAQDNSGKLFVYLFNSGISKNQFYRIDGITAAGTTGTATLLTIPLGEEDADADFFANQVFVSNSKLYVSSNYHIYISSDAGANWTTVNFNKSSLFPVKKGSDYAICAGTSGAVYTSQDDGKSWMRTSMPTTYSTGYIVDIAEDASGDYYGAGQEASVLKFTNDLVLPPASLPTYIDFNWQPTAGPYGGTPVRLHVDNANNVYTTAANTIFRTTSSVASWTDKGKAGLFLSDLEIDKANNKLFAISSTQLYTSVNGGDSWDLTNNENISGRRLLRRCPNGDLVLAASLPTAGIFISADNGVTFGSAKFTYAPKTVIDLVVTSSNAIIVYMVDPLTLTFDAVISTNRGVTWTPMALNNNTEFGRISSDDNNNIYSTSEPPSKSSNNGQNWTSVAGNLTVEPFTSKIFVSPANALYVSGVVNNLNGLYKSTNNGTTWVKTGDLLGISSINSICWMGSKMIVATTQGLYVSDDDGVTLNLKSQNIPNAGALDLELVNPSKLLLATSNGMNFSSTDLNEWTHDRELNLRSFFSTPDDILYGQSATNLYNSSDDGNTWSEVSTFPEPTLKVVSPNGQTFYAVTGSNIFVSTDLATWTSLGVSGLPPQFNYRDIVVDDAGTIYTYLFNPAVGGDEVYQIVFGSASKLTRFNTPRSLSYHRKLVYVYESTGVISSTADGLDWAVRSAPNGNSLTITDNNYYFVAQSAGSVWLSRDEGNTWQSVGRSNVASNISFHNFVVNEFNGYAYAALSNSVIMRSAGIVIPAETVKPIVGTLKPANNAIAVSPATTLRITFDEACIPVTGKKIRIFNATNEISPVEVIDVTDGIQHGKSFTFTPATPLKTLNTYFIIVDVGAFKDIFENLFLGLVTPLGWRFTIGDDVKPNIEPVAPAFVKGANNKLIIKVTDEAGGSGVNPAGVKVHYRGITATASLTEANMANTSGTNFEVSVSDPWMDELGLEYYFEARDNQGNTQLSPADALTNGNYYRAYIAFSGEASNPTVPQSLLSFGGKKENYRMFSIPYKLTDASINTIFNEISSLEPKKDFRLLHFNTASTKYAEYPTLTSISRGSGYWINIKNSVSIEVEGASTPENNKDDLFSLTLNPGWNQIGNPYPFTISWNAVKDSSPEKDNIGVLKTFNGSAFVDDDKLNSFEGGFVLFSGSSSIEVEFPFSAKTTTGRIREAGPDFQGGWMLPLLVENSKFTTQGGIGMHPDAGLSFDRFDDAMPPEVFDVPKISFDHGEHFLKYFTRDVIPMADKRVWQFTVNSPEEKSTLKWDPQFARSIASDLFLLDEGTQTIYRMGEEDHCDIPTGNSSSFKIYFGYRHEDIKPSSITLGRPYPNPFTSQTRIAFSLPENSSTPYNISLDVYDMLGRKLATVARGQFTSGFYVREWLPEPGTINASLYIFRLTVSGEKTDVILTEKIVTKQ